MNRFYLLLLCLIPLAGISQTTLYFSYDAAGNQVLRDVVCVNCGNLIVQSSTLDEDTVLSRTSATALEPGKEKSDLTSQSFIASPNPVTNKLRVQWVYQEANPLQSLQLHTSDGRLLQRHPIKTPAGQTELDFSKYNSGLYYLTGTGANGL